MVVQHHFTNNSARYASYYEHEFDDGPGEADEKKSPTGGLMPPASPAVVEAKTEVEVKAEAVEAVAIPLHPDMTGGPPVCVNNSLEKQAAVRIAL